MLQVSGLRKILTIAAFRSAPRSVVMALLLASPALAGPITYSGFTITDGKLGSWQFHNARVFLTFESDTNNVQTLNVPIPNTTQTVTIAYNPTGVARITIVGEDRTVHATFKKGQIFASYDLSNGGVGFGSFAPDGSFQPAYPLGVAGGTVDGPAAVGLAFGPSPEELALSADLMSDTGLSGRGWVCVTFPDATCPAPTVPLKTNKGDLFLFQPYQVEPQAPNGGKVLNAGLFFADKQDPDSGFPPSLFAESGKASSKDITYNVFLVSDVSIGGRRFNNAKIHLSFSSDTSTVKPLSGTGPKAFVNEDGIARVVITKGSTTIKAKFDRHQIYVFFDPSTGSVGFGSHSGGRAYPVTVTQCACNSPQLVGAVSDIIDSNGADANKYTPKTATLLTDLTNETVLADFASSCSPYSAFDVVNGFCSNLSAVPAKLTTNEGDFYLFEPYTQTQTSFPFSNNWALFWSNFSSDQREDE
jgi:hypothetical protein